jgi:hypothetical protein
MGFFFFCNTKNILFVWNMLYVRSFVRSFAFLLCAASSFYLFLLGGQLVNAL